MDKIPVLDGSGRLLGMAETRAEAWHIAGPMAIDVMIDAGGGESYFRVIRREGPRHWVRLVAERDDGRVWEATRADGVAMFCLEAREPPTWADAAWYSRSGAVAKGWVQ